MITRVQINDAAEAAHHKWASGRDPIYSAFVEAVKAGVALAQAEPPPPRITAVTGRQHDLLVFIADYVDRHGYAPTFREMAVALGFASKSGVAQVLDALVSRGAIRRRSHHSRGIQLLARPVVPEVRP